MPSSPLAPGNPSPDTLTALEQELRFVFPEGFQPPERLAGLQRTTTARAVHRDRYFDGQDRKGRPALYRHHCTLRVREQGPETALVTFKQRVAGEAHVGVARLETQAPLYGPAAAPELLAHTVNHLDHPALQAAREHAAGVLLVELFTVVCDRTDHRYCGPDGELIVSEDLVTYPDGSQERRLEVELQWGSPKLLRRADRKLRRAYPQLRSVRRGKQGEARRRLARMLGV